MFCFIFLKGAGSPICRTVRLFKAILSGPPLSTCRAWVGSCGPRLRLLPTHRAPERGDLRLFLTEPQRVPCPWTENALRKKKKLIPLALSLPWSTKGGQHAVKQEPVKPIILISLLTFLNGSPCARQGLPPWSGGALRPGFLRKDKRAAARVLLPSARGALPGLGLPGGAHNVLSGPRCPPLLHALLRTARESAAVEGCGAT